MANRPRGLHCGVNSILSNSSILKLQTLVSGFHTKHVVFEGVIAIIYYTFHLVRIYMYW